MGGDDHTDDFVPTYLNFEPVVILSLSESELMTTALSALCFSLPIGIVSALFSNSVMVGMVVFITLLIGGMYIGAFIFKTFKRGKPRGYFGTLLKVKLGFPSQFYLKDKPLTLGRSEKKVVRYVK